MIRIDVRVVVLCVIVPSARAGETWPSWRGPGGQGVADDARLPVTWGGTTAENVVWKSPLPWAEDQSRRDLNQSSPVVWKDRLFLIGASWPKGVEQREYPKHHVACYATHDGRKLWDVEIPPGPWRLTDLRGGYSAPTPATDGERLYTLFGSSVLAALDFDGKLVWRKEVAPFAWDVAIGTSPVLYKETVLVLADGSQSERSRLIAFDKKTGNVAWEKPRPQSSFSHSTPLLIEVQGKPQLVVAASSELEGLDPADGKVLWFAKMKGDVPTPVFGQGLVYSEDGRGGFAAAVDPSGMGDVSASHVRWNSKPIPEGYSSPIVSGDFVYRTHNPGVLNCLRLSTGEVIYSARLPPGVDLSASPILTPENNLLFASGGKSVVVPVGPKFEIIATNDLDDPGSASPAVAQGRLYIKGGNSLWCIGSPWTGMLGTLTKSEGAGFGGLCGVCVDRTTGDVLINISDRGFYRSTDGAKSFKRISDTQPKGRTETPGCFAYDPTGKTKTLLTALVYGAPVSLSDDGAVWKPMHGQSQHVDWAAVDWTDPERKFVLALKHEAGELLIASHDGGQTFQELGKGFGPGWVFEARTAVVARGKSKENPKPALVRTTDAGQTWTPCGDFRPVGNGSTQALPKWFDGALYWLVEGTLIFSEDAGKTWKTISAVKSGRYGPVFGKSKAHLFVLTTDGVIESTNGGADWSKPIALPQEVKGAGLAWLDYDPRGGHLYLMRMGSDLYKLTPAGKPE